MVHLKACVTLESLSFSYKERMQKQESKVHDDCGRSHTPSERMELTHTDCHPTFSIFIISWPPNYLINATFMMNSHQLLPHMPVVSEMTSQ